MGRQLRRGIAWPAVVVVWASALCVVSAARGENQTPTVTPPRDVSALPYRISIRPFDLGADERPTLQSFASARYDGKWLFIGGRTNGRHSLGAPGLGAFPPAYQNRDVWVIDPSAKRAWRRSLESHASRLTFRQVDSLTNTNAEYYQRGDKLYYAGGYGFDRATNDFLTYDTLASIDVPGLMAWVTAPDAPAQAGGAAQYIRQVQDPIVKVTGGAMLPVGDLTHLVFGQDFSRGYHPGATGEYTKQVRSFRIVDDASGLRLEGQRQTPPDPSFRRRDLNVVRRMRVAPGSPAPEESLAAFGGVFTETMGAWTVPVLIDADGTPHMADPADPGTFRQGMNNYTAANVGLFSAAENKTHAILFGGITYGSVDRATGQYTQDELLPFTSNVTAVTVDADGRFAQYLMNEDFPALTAADGKALLFGANGEFLAADGVPTWSNGLINLDAITTPTTLGYVYGGIMADAPNGGITAASGLAFEVVLTPVPEPTAAILLTAIVAAAARRRRGR